MSDVFYGNFEKKISLTFLLALFLFIIFKHLFEPAECALSISVNAQDAELVEESFY